jgi:hypothetical protein
MKGRLFLLVVLLGAWSNFAISQRNTPKSCIEDFFTSFHNQDTTALRNFFHEKAAIQTVSHKDKRIIVKEETIDELVLGIASIPSEVDFEERLKRIKHRSDGVIAQVWIPYTFYVNGERSHQGVNSFTLVNVNDSWQIIHLIDTRRK